MTTDKMADVGARALCGLVILLVFATALIQGQDLGAFGVATILASPFVLVALAPNRFARPVGHGLMFIITLVAFYDPPSSVTFDLGRFAFALPFMVVGLLLGARELRILAVASIKRIRV